MWALFTGCITGDVPGGGELEPQTQNALEQVTPKSTNPNVTAFSDLNNAQAPNLAQPPKETSIRVPPLSQLTADI